jgi:hypothetical protein
MSIACHKNERHTTEYPKKEKCEVVAVQGIKEYGGVGV